eukprot:SAG22_NODE_41_length_25488_cov_6.133719_15_plen_228_part_00
MAAGQTKVELDLDIWIELSIADEVSRAGGRETSSVSILVSVVVVIHSNPAMNLGFEQDNLRHLDFGSRHLKIVDRSVVCSPRPINPLSPASRPAKHRVRPRRAQSGWCWQPGAHGLWGGDRAARGQRRRGRPDLSLRGCEGPGLPRAPSRAQLGVALDSSHASALFAAEQKRNPATSQWAMSRFDNNVYWRVGAASGAHLFPENQTLAEWQSAGVRGGHSGGRTGTA